MKTAAPLLFLLALSTTASGQGTYQGFSARFGETDGAVVVRTTLPDGTEAEVDSCDAFLDRLRAAQPATAVGDPEFGLQIGYLYLFSPTGTLIDIGHGDCEDVSRDPDGYSTSSLALLSVLGPLVSVSLQRSQALAGGPPYHAETWQAFDLRTGARARLDDFVTEESLLTALKGDPYVAERLSPDFLQQVASSRELLAALNRSMPSPSPDNFTAFAVHSYDASTGFMALRLAFRPDTAGLDTNEQQQLGLMVRPAPEFQPFLQGSPAGITLSTPGRERLTDW